MCMDDTLGEEDVFFKISDELENTKLIFLNLVLVKTTFPQNFIVDERLTTIFPACVTRHEQLRMRTMTKQTNSYSPWFLDLKLSITGAGPVFFLGGGASLRNDLDLVSYFFFLFAECYPSHLWCTPLAPLP